MYESICFIELVLFNQVFKTRKQLKAIEPINVDYLKTIYLINIPNSIISPLGIHYVLSVHFFNFIFDFKSILIFASHILPFGHGRRFLLYLHKV